MSRTPASGSDHAQPWLVDAVTGIRGWLVVCGIFALFGFGYLPGAYQDRTEARNVAHSSVPVIASRVGVHIDYEYARGGGWYEVDDVRVHLPGTTGMADLDAVANADELSDRFTWRSCWQVATGPTGYQAPLPVRVQYDGDGTPKRAITQRDVDYWTNDNTDPEFNLAIGAGALSLGVLSIAVRAALTRRARAKVAGRSSAAFARRADRHRDASGTFAAGKPSRRQLRR